MSLKQDLSIELLTQMRHSQDVQGPHAPVAESMPYHLHCHTLTVMHIRFGWIVAQHSVHDDDLLSVRRWRKLHIRREQGSGAHRSVNQPLGRNHALVCVGPWRHQREGKQTAQTGENPLNEK